MSFYSQVEVKKTRKEHTCDGCFDKIPAGSPAVRMSGTFEGEFFSTIICEPCEKFMKIHREHFEDGWSEGDIGEARKEMEGISA
jgi:RNase P subunit RPR2